MERPITQSWPRQTIQPSEVYSREDLYFLCKRILDFTLALIALIVLAIPMAFVAMLIALETPGPVIFSQKRIGARRRKRHGRVEWETVNFTFYKFRSMYHNSDSTVHQQFMKAFIKNDRQKLAQVQNSISPAADNGSEVSKLVNDPRITKVGRIIRKTSIDELPQLWNVIKGNMSLVGPRPSVSYELEEYNDWQKKRLEAIPGLTCLWQVNGRSATDFDGQVALDIEYIEKRSLWMDIKILFLTIPAVLACKGAR